MPYHPITRARIALRRAGTAVAAVAVSATGIVALDSTPSAAVGASHHEVDVVNLSGTDVNVRFAYSADDSAGRVSSVDYQGARRLPVNNTAVPSGARAGNFAYSVPTSTSDNGFWVDVSRVDDPADRSVAKVHRTSSSHDSPHIRATDQAGASLTISSRYVPTSAGFSGSKTRIVVSEAAAHSDTPVGPPTWPHPGVWELDTNVGVSHGGWKALGDGSAIWQLPGLMASSDYWFRCYTGSMSTLSFNGVTPRDNQMGDPGFWATSDARGVITVLRDSGSAHGGVCDVHSGPTPASAERITGASTYRGVNERPIYRVDIAPRVRLFDSAVPNQFRVPSYSVQGSDASGNWSDVGVVLPASAPSVSGTSVTYGGATFFFQNAVGQSITQLRVSGGFGSWSSVIDLADLPAPTDSIADLSALTVGMRSQVGSAIVALEANGTAQEALDLTLRNSEGGVIAPGAPLAGLTDNVYYRDERGVLITGFYKAEGSTSISRARGSAGAAKGASLATDYVSTTDGYGGTTWITAQLSLDDTLDNGADLDLAFFRPTLSLAGSLPAGAVAQRHTSDGVSQAALAAPGSSLLTYRVAAAGSGAVSKPGTVVVVRSATLIDAGALPRTDITQGLGVTSLMVQAGTLKPTSGLSALAGIPLVHVLGVTGGGAAVSGAMPVQH